MSIARSLLAGFTAIAVTVSVCGASVVVTAGAAHAQDWKRHGGRGHVAGPRGGYRGHGYARGHRGHGYGRAAGAAAAIGVLGILGAAAAANASRPDAVYEDDCPLVRRRVYFDDGSYVIRRVPAC